MTRVSVVGLGKLGVCMAAALAHKGFEVWGVDTNPQTIDLVNSCEPPIFEPGLQEMMLGARHRLHATDLVVRIAFHPHAVEDRADDVEAGGLARPHVENE